MADSFVLAQLNEIVGSKIARRSVVRGAETSASASTGGPVR
jgi:hypothetical protein